MKPATDEEQLAAARSLCKTHNLFISVKPGKYHVYRKTAPKPTHEGFKRTPAELLHYVERLVKIK